MSVSDITSSAPLSKEGMKVLSSMMRLCSRREYCVSDIRRKIERSAASGSEDEIIRILLREGFVDESRYAEAYAREKLEIGGWGRFKVRYVLRQKGIPDDIVEAALSRTEKTRVDDVVGKKWEQIRKKYPDERRAVSLSRLLRFTAGRGFGYDEVMECLKRNDL